MSEDLTTDPIRQLQDEIENDIKADPWFGTSISIIRSEPADVLVKLNTTLGKLGICIVIQPLSGKTESEMLELNVGITVNERPLINRGSTGSRKTATQVVLQLCRVFSERAGKCVILNSWDLVDDGDSILVYLLKGKLTARFS